MVRYRTVRYRRYVGAGCTVQTSCTGLYMLRRLFGKSSSVSSPLVGAVVYGILFIYLTIFLSCQRVIRSYVIDGLRESEHFARSLVVRFMFYEEILCAELNVLCSPCRRGACYFLNSLLIPFIWISTLGFSIYVVLICMFTGNSHFSGTCGTNMLGFYRGCWTVRVFLECFHCLRGVWFFACLFLLFEFRVWVKILTMCNMYVFRK